MQPRNPITPEVIADVRAFIAYRKRQSMTEVSKAIFGTNAGKLLTYLYNDRRDIDDSTGWIDISAGNLETELNMSRYKLHSARKALERLGVIDVKRTKSSKGMSCLYWKIDNTILDPIIKKYRQQLED